MFVSLLRQRRSVRKFLKKEVEKEKIETLLEAALRSPSSRGFNPWQFIVVTDRSLLEKLSSAKKHGSTFLQDAPLGIVVCGDPQASDTWVEDTAIASIIIQMAAESLDLGSCWIQVRRREHDDQTSAEQYIAGLLNIPSHLRVEAIMAIGYPDGKPAPHGDHTLQHEKIYLNGFGKPFSC